MMGSKPGVININIVLVFYCIELRLIEFPAIGSGGIISCFICSKKSDAGSLVAVNKIAILKLITAFVAKYVPIKTKEFTGIFRRR